MTEKLYVRMARTMDAYIRCNESPDHGWTDKHHESLESMVDNYMPSGSGIDTGTTLDFARSSPNKLVFLFGYHHMDENGYYDGWTDHKCIVTPSLAFGIDIKITGSNRNDIKDYLYQTFEMALTQEVE
jgi:hypothetical protein